MSKKTIEIVVTVLLVVVLGLLMVNNIKKTSSKKLKEVEGSLQITAVSSPSSVSVSADERIIKLQKERAEALVWVRDPFQYIETEKDKSYRTDALVLKGISLGKQRPGYAFINDEIVKTGDTIGGYEVVQIQKDKVLLKRESQIFYLTMPEE